MSSNVPDVDAPAPPPTVIRSTADLVRAAVSGWLGTALEFMDYQLYSLAAALVFADLFFSNEDPAMAVVAAMAGLLPEKNTSLNTSAAASE